MIDPSQILEMIQGIPDPLTAALLATLPVTELRLALPIALVALQMHPVAAYIATVLGNLVPLVAVFWLLPPVLQFTLRYVPRINTVLDAYFARLMNKHGEKYSKWGAFFLFLFVAIPLPGTGVWTGSVLAVLFRIKPKLAATYIVLGLLTAGLIVMGITLGVFTGIQGI